MKKEILYNKIDRNILISELNNETFERKTCSFYKYINIANPKQIRDNLYSNWSKLGIFGRIYIAKEGINAQLSCPIHNWGNFIKDFKNINIFKNIVIKEAIVDGKSFYKLTIKVRNEIVSYGLQKNQYDIKKTGEHITSLEFNKKINNENTILVDMRNYYESEVGKFKNALIPDQETSKQLLPKVKKILKGKENNEILMYCTGGIRCEKASAYLIKQGFKNVKQLKGGIIQYAHDQKKYNFKSMFIGKNFVFDRRMSERVTDDVIGNCHICNNPADHHVDCNNDSCHILFIQCEECNKKLEGCCSQECKDFYFLPKSKQQEYKKDPNKVISNTLNSNSIKPRLNSITRRCKVEQ